MFGTSSFFLRTATNEVKADAGGATPLTVEAIDNHVYFYARVDSDRCLALLLAIREADATLRSERISRGLGVKVRFMRRGATPQKL